MKLKITSIGNSAGVILPKELLARLRLDKGDELYAIETPDGILLTSRRAAIERDLAGVDAELREHGLTLDEVVESGREIRGEIARERYRLDG